MIIIEKLISALRNAAIFNPDVQMAPACILWPDRDHQWEAVILRLQAESSELFVLGDYAPKREPAQPSGYAVSFQRIAERTSDYKSP